MNYIVTIGYNKFSFNDSLEAICFADRAKNHYIPDDVCESIRVEIELKDDEPAVAENKED